MPIPSYGGGFLLNTAIWLLGAIMIAIIVFIIVGHQSNSIGNIGIVSVVFSIPLVMYIISWLKLNKYDEVVRIATANLLILYISLVCYIAFSVIPNMQVYGNIFSALSLLSVLLIICYIFVVLGDHSISKISDDDPTILYLYFLITFFMTFLVIMLQFSFTFAFHDMATRIEIEERARDDDLENDTLLYALDYGATLDSNPAANRFETIILFERDSVNIDADGLFLNDVEDIHIIPSNLLQQYDENRNKDAIIRGLNSLSIREILNFVDNNKNSAIYVSIVGNASSESSNSIDNERIAYLRAYNVRNFLETHYSLSYQRSIDNKCILTYDIYPHPLNNPSALLELRSYHVIREDAPNVAQGDSINFANLDSIINSWNGHGAAYSAIVRLESRPLRYVSRFNSDHLSSPRTLTLLDYIYFSVSTMTTSSYGDIKPVSDYSKMLTILANFCQVAFIVFVVSALSFAFQNHRPPGSPAVPEPPSTPPDVGPEGNN